MTRASADLGIFAFPGEPKWRPEQRAVVIRWRRGPETASAWLPALALAVLAGENAAAHEIVHAVYLHRAQLEHAIEAKIRRRRTAKGDLRLTRNDVWRATHAD